MRDVCNALPGPKMANIIEGGETPDLPNAVLHDIGYSIVTYPLTLMASAMQAMVTTLRSMRDGTRTDIMDFGDLRRRIGFEDYYDVSERYSTARRVKK